MIALTVNRSTWTCPTALIESYIGCLPGLQLPIVDLRLSAARFPVATDTLLGSWCFKVLRLTTSSAASFVKPSSRRHLGDFRRASQCRLWSPLPSTVAWHVSRLVRSVRFDKKIISVDVAWCCPLPAVAGSLRLEIGFLSIGRGKRVT